MIFTPRDLDRLVGVEQTADLLQGLGGDDQVRLRRALGLAGRHIHPGEPMTVGGHHPHPLGTQLPEHAVQDWTAFFGACGECHVPDQLLELPGGGAPSTLELQTGECRKLLARESRSRKRERPHSMVTRCSPEAVSRMAALGSSRTISTSLRAGKVMAPSWSTDAETVVLTEISRSVPERRMPSLPASSNMFDRIGNVVFAGTLAATATRPSCSCSRVIVSFMPLLGML